LIERRCVYLPFHLGKIHFPTIPTARCSPLREVSSAIISFSCSQHSATFGEMSRQRGPNGVKWCFAIGMIGRRTLSIYFVLMYVLHCRRGEQVGFGWIIFCVSFRLDGAQHFVRDFSGAHMMYVFVCRSFTWATSIKYYQIFFCSQQSDNPGELSKQCGPMGVLRSKDHGSRIRHLLRKTSRSAGLDKETYQTEMIR